MESAIVDVLQFNFYDHHKLVLSHSGRLLTFISPSFALTTYTLPALFRLAVSAGHYSHSAHASSAPESSTAARDRAKRLDEVRTLLGKVEYVRDVLKTLAQRKPSSSTTTGAARDGGRERAERA
ncbi:hypothetical protein JCM8208_000114 [Rhodotorula glutinis]